jgi:N-acetyl-gamma-glutamyl-phosphate reductase
LGVLSLYKIGIAGDTGMVGQEIDKVLKGHDKVDIIYRKNSSREEGTLANCDVIFLATKDKESMELSIKAMDSNVKVIDMSGAFRLPQDSFEKWYGMKHEAVGLINEAVYGMPALFFDKIAGAKLVANPGCYPTSVILALHPLVNLLEKEVSIVSTSGNSGARREVESFSNDVAYSYGRKHKHVPEMELYSGFKVDFTPIVLRSIYKGINTNIRAVLKEGLRNMPSEKVAKLIEDTISASFAPADNVYIVKDSSEKVYGTGDVNDTHNMLIKINVDEGKVYINSLIDNLMKGAASQGVENMNIMLGLPRLYSIEGDK